MLFPLLVFAFVGGAIMPRFRTFATFHVLLPLALIRRPVRVVEAAAAMGFVVQPLPLVDIAIRVRELAPSNSSVILELALVRAAVRPREDAAAVPSAVSPLAGVRGAAAELHRAHLHHLALRTRRL